LAEENLREQQILEALQEYKRKYRPEFMSLIIKEGFLDIYNLETKSYCGEKCVIDFDEEGWLRFKADLIDCLKNVQFQVFISHYFKHPNLFEFVDYYADYYCRLVWNFKKSAPGKNLFERAGAVMICDVHDCWIILVFSNEDVKKTAYEIESKALEKVIQKLI
jgi:hypothetical protein